MARVAFVTGGTRGIGKAISARLRTAGYQVAAGYAGNEVAAKAAADELGLMVVKGNVGNFADCKAAVDAVTAELGPIDILVNNAGVSGRSRMDDPEAPAVWDRILAVNLEGVFNVTHAFVPQLKTTHGCIINLSSIVAFVSGISSAGYIASKGAVRSLTQALARDLAPFGVRANAVAPGYIASSGMDHYDEKFRTETIPTMAGLAPLKRMGEEAEVSAAIVFLLSGPNSIPSNALARDASACVASAPSTFSSTQA